MRYQEVTQYFKNKDIIILNGAMGTELQRRGYQTKLPLWSAQANLNAWHLVKNIHEDYFKAGADISITNTFRTTPRSFKKVGREPEARKAAKEAVRACREAQKCVTRKTYVGGSIAPLEDCYEPENVPNEKTLREEHTVHAEWFLEDNIDFLVLETLNSKKEALILSEIANNLRIPYFISFVVDSEGKLLDGTALKDVIESTRSELRLAVSINCRPIDVLDAAFNKLITVCDDPIAIYPNGFGKPHNDLGWKFENNSDSIQKFVSIAHEWHQKGAKIIGGCCGTTPDYIKALANSFKNQKKDAA